MKLNKIILIISLILILTCIHSVSAGENATVLTENPDSIYVDDINGDDLNNGLTNTESVKSIEKAVTSAQNNTDVYLKEGTYSGSKNTRITINKSLNFIGSGETVIDGEGVNYLFTVTGDVNVTFKNIKFINAYKSPESYAINYPDSVYGSAIEVKSGEVLVENCIFENNQLTYSTNNKPIYGGAISNSGDLTITDSRFTSNIAHSTSGLFSYGGSIYNNGSLKISKTNFAKSNVDDFNYGGFIANNADLTITDSIIANAFSAGESRGSAIYNTGKLNLFNSTVENNTVSKAGFQYIYGAIYSSASLNAVGNIFRNNTGLYSTPSRGSPTIYSSGDLNLTFNLFLNNHKFEGVSNDVYMNSLGEVFLENNWWGSNQDPFTTNAVNLQNQVKSWLKLNITPSYTPLNIGESVDIVVKWNLINNLIPKSLITVNGNEFDLKDSVVSTFTDTLTKGLKFVTVEYYDFSEVLEVDVGKILTDVSVDFNHDLSYMDDLIVDIHLTSPDGVPDGVVLVEVDGKLYNISLANGHVNYAISGLNPGSYEVKVSYNGSEKYFKSFTNSNLTVNKRLVCMNLTVNDIYVDERATASITLSPEGSDATGILTVNGKRKIVYLYVSKVTTIDLGYFSEGKVNLTLSYMENSLFKADPVNITFRVKKYESQINITAPDIIMGDTQNLLIKVNPEDLRGYAILNINNNDYEVFLENETTTVKIPNLRPGTYNLKLTYEGDEKYSQATATASFNVLKHSSSINVNVVYDDDTLKGSIHVKANAANCTGEVEVDINYNIYRINLTNGEAAFQVEYDKGTNYIYVHYYGDDYWAESDWNTTIGVADEFILMSEDVEAYEHKDFNYSVRVIEPSGVPLPLRTVTIHFKNTDYNVTTDTNGFAYFKLNLDPETYTISATYKNQTVTNTLHVREILFNLTVANTTYGEMNIFRAVFDKNVKGQVNFTINESLSVIVDIINGVALYNTSSLDVGNYTLKAFYTNPVFTSQVKTGDFEVSKASSTMTFTVSEVIEGENGNITLLLPVRASGNVTFILDGEASQVSLQNNLAVLNFENIGGGNHTLKIIYSGDNNYDSSIIDSSFYIKDLRTNLIITSSNINYLDVLTVKIRVNEDARGNVTITVGNNSKTLNLDNGYAECNVSGLNAGKYEVSAVYNGNEHYITASNSSEVEVFRINSTITIVCDAYLDENVLIYAFLSSNATGSVSFSMPGYYTSRNKEISDSVALWYISPLDTGSYTVKAEYLGDNNYYPSNISYVITINQVKTRLKVEISDVTVDERVRVNIILKAGDNEKLNTTVTLFLNSRKYDVPVRNGEALFILGKLAEGDYGYSAGFTGDGIYTSSGDSGKFSVVEKIITKINANPVNKYYGGGEKLTITLTDSNNNPLPLLEVNVKLNNENHVLTTDRDGKAYFDVNLPVGEYAALISFGESEKYASSLVNVNVSVKTTVQGIDVVKRQGTSSQYFAIFLDSSGRALADAQVKYTIGDKEVYAKTLPNGISRLDINLNPGFYLITAYNPQTGEIATNSIFIYNPLMENSDLTQSYTENKIYSVRAYDDNGNVAGAGQKVMFKINAKTYNVLTDKNGYASLKIILNPGKYTVTASYNNFRVSNKVEVKSILVVKNIKVKKTAKKLKIKLSLKKVNAKYLKGKKITLKFKGKTYKAKTNKKGVATFTIKKKILKKLKKGKKYTYRVTYLKDTVKKTIKVK